MSLQNMEALEALHLISCNLSVTVVVCSEVQRREEPGKKGNSLCTAIAPDALQLYPLRTVCLHQK